MKKRVSVLLMVIVMILGMTQTAFADTNDHRVKLNWTKDAPYSSSPFRKKDNNSQVYFKVVNGTLPGNGFYICAVYGPDNACAFQTKWYYINDYRPYAIDIGVSDLAGINVSILTWYPSEWGYNWGNVTIDWSPDYTPQSGVTILR